MSIGVSLQISDVATSENSRNYINLIKVSMKIEVYYITTFKCLVLQTFQVHVLFSFVCKATLLINTADASSNNVI